MMNRRGAGKLSIVLISFLMINIVGYILMADYVPVSNNPYVQGNSLLQTLYTPATDGSGDTVYVIGSGSALYGSVPQNPPEPFINQVGSFIDRIFTLFEFIRVIIGVLAFPIALITFMGIPWQLSMLFITPLVLLYVIGLIDLFSGGDS